MLPLLLIIPGVFIVWSLAKKHAERELLEGGGVDSALDRALARRHATGARGGMMHHPSQIPAYQIPAYQRYGAAGPAALPPSAPPSSTAGYIEYLRQASQAAAALNLVRSQAIAADVGALMQAPPEAVQALVTLAQPIDTITVQRSLNLLGASPPLEENGKMDKRTREAVAAFQERFRQVPTGNVDEAVAIALGYAVGVVNFQNQMQGAA